MLPKLKRGKEGKKKKIRFCHFQSKCLDSGSSIIHHQVGFWMEETKAQPAARCLCRLLIESPRSDVSRWTDGWKDEGKGMDGWMNYWNLLLA